MEKKRKTSILQKNIKYLREKNELSLQGIANALGVLNRATYYSWERGDAEPNIKMLMKLANEFDISVDELIRVDLAKKSLYDIEMNKIDTYEVEMVPYKVAAGYSASYSDPEWLFENIRTISIPYKPPHGEARAFPIIGDSMEPKVSDGSYVIGVKLESPMTEVVQGQDYIVVTRTYGIMFKILFWKGDKVQLVSLNHSVQAPIELEGNEILQIWKFFCSLNSARTPKNRSV